MSFLFQALGVKECLISLPPQSCRTWLVHNPGADGTSKHCRRDLAGSYRTGKGALSHGAVVTELIILVKEKKKTRLVYKLDIFCGSQNIQTDIPKMFPVVGYYRTSQDDYLKRTLI